MNEWNKNFSTLKHVFDCLYSITDNSFKRPIKTQLMKT